MLAEISLIFYLNVIIFSRIALCSLILYKLPIYKKINKLNTNQIPLDLQVALINTVPKRCF